jgi:hypothetical protein
MTQHNLKQGTKKFGNDSKAAVMAELQRLHDSDVMKPVGKCNLTPAERKGALCCLMFLKEKRDGMIEDSGCLSWSLSSDSSELSMSSTMMLAAFTLLALFSSTLLSD